MHVYHRGHVGVALFLALLLSADAAGAGRDPEFSLSIRADTGEIVSHEPLRLTVSLENISDKAIEADIGFVTTLKFTSERTDGGSAIIVLGSQAGKDLGGSRNLVPGEEITSAEMLFLFREHGRYGFVFAEPGQYRVKVSAELGRGRKIESEFVNVLVKPVPPDHLAAAKLVTDVMAARVLQGWDLTADGAGALEKVAAEFPDSLYADHANYALAGYYQNKHLSKEGGDVAAAKRAFEHFSAVSARIGAMRVRALLQMAGIACSVPRDTLNADLGQLLLELKAYGPFSERIGEGKRGATLCRQLEGLRAVPLKAP